MIKINKYCVVGANGGAVDFDFTLEEAREKATKWDQEFPKDAPHTVCELDRKSVV